MVPYSVNQAINDKKSVIKIQNSMFTKCDINNTYMYKSSGIHVHTSGTVSPIKAAINQDVPNLTIENEQQISRVSSYMYLVWTSLNEIKKRLFSRPIQIFILATVIANEQYTSHLHVSVS